MTKVQVQKHEAEELIRQCEKIIGFFQGDGRIKDDMISDQYRTAIALQNFEEAKLLRQKGSENVKEYSEMRMALELAETLLFFKSSMEDVK